MELEISRDIRKYVGLNENTTLQNLGNNESSSLTEIYSIEQEINVIENKKSVEKINDIRNHFFQKINRNMTPPLWQKVKRN